MENRHCSSIIQIWKEFNSTQLCLLEWCRAVNNRPLHFAIFSFLLCSVLANNSPVNHKAIGQSSSCHYVMGAAITSLLLPCLEGKGQGWASVRNGEETAAPVLYIDGTDTCHGLCFEFARPHCCLSPSEDSVINIVGGEGAYMNTKVLLCLQWRICFTID